MRKLLLGVAGAAALGLGAVAAVPAPAQAQGFSIAVGEPYGAPPVYRPYRNYRPVYYRPVRYYPAYPRYVRPVYYDYGPTCRIRTTRYWDGYGWVARRREICR
jgi:hypothetical protein